MCFLPTPKADPSKMPKLEVKQKDQNKVWIGIFLFLMAQARLAMGNMLRNKGPPPLYVTVLVSLALKFPTKMLIPILFVYMKNRFIVPP